MVYSRTSKRLVQVAAGLGSSLAPFMVGSMLVAAPTIGDDFSADVALLGWLTAAFFLIAAACLVPFGRVADVQGAKKVFVAGLAVYVVSGLISALSPDIYVLIFARALAGVGAAMIFGTSIALLGLVFPPEERGKAIGINVTAMFVGFTLGLLAGGFLSYYLSWRSIFLIVVVVAAVDLFLILTRLKGECELTRVKDHDVVGMVLYGCGIVLSFYGLSEIDTLYGVVFLVLGGAVVLAFVRWERRYPHPLIHRSVSGDARLRLATVTNLLFQGGSFAIPFIFSLYLQYVSDMDSRYASFILIIPQTLMIALGPVSGRLSDRWSSPFVAAIGCLLSLFGLSLVVGIGEGTSLVRIVLALLFIGAGTAFFMPAILSWALRKIPMENFGVASAFTETSRLAGMTLSNAVIIVIFSVYMGGSVVNKGNIPEFITSAQVAFAVFLAFTLTGMVLALWGWKRMKVDEGAHA
jgi:MFS family permease